MRDWQAFFKGKKVTILGLGLLGRGVGDAKFLAQNGAELIVTDLKHHEDLQSSLLELAPFANITYRLGGHALEDFQGRDFILKAASVPLDSPYIAEARKNAIPIKMSASWFLELAEIPSVGVTGTRGKSTVTHLLHRMLEADQRHVVLGGNVRGVSTLALLPETQKDSLALLELDSWQCQGFGESKLSPHVAVFTTFYPDHLNYYASLDAYLDDKAQIFLHQKEDDILILGAPVADLIRGKYGSRIRSRIVVADPSHFPDGWAIKMVGTHNLLNAVCAIEAARSLGVSDSAIQEAVATFPGVPGRLQLLGELDGIAVYNDTTSTTPDATIAALHAIPGENIVLIMGGADKGLDMAELAALIPAYVKKVILLSGTGTEGFLKKYRPILENAIVHESLEDALADALSSAAKGDSILFSPAFASFGMFKNEFDRGERFERLVKGLELGL